MKKTILIVIVVGMFGWTVYDFTSSTNETAIEEEQGGMITSTPPSDDEDEVTESEEIGLALGQIAPDFELETLKRETVRLSDFRGTRVIINFWATWCPL